MAVPVRSAQGDLLGVWSRWPIAGADAKFFCHVCCKCVWKFAGYPFVAMSLFKSQTQSCIVTQIFFFNKFNNNKFSSTPHRKSTHLWHSIIIVFLWENTFSHALDRKFSLKILAENHCTSICRPVKSECTSCRVHQRCIQFLLSTCQCFTTLSLSVKKLIMWYALIYYAS